MRLTNLYKPVICCLIGFSLGILTASFHSLHFSQNKKNLIKEEAKEVLTDLAFQNYQIKLLDSEQTVELRESMTRRLSAYVSYFQIFNSQFTVNVDGLSYEEEIAKAKNILEISKGTPEIP